jgi:hypothetical protein
MVRAFQIEADGIVATMIDPVAPDGVMAIGERRQTPPLIATRPTGLVTDTGFP